MRKLPLKFSDEAAQDIKEILDYHVNILPSLVDMFLTDFDVSCESIESFPEAWKEQEGYRRKLLKQFSYAIHYKITPTNVYILRVFHTSRRPDSWR